MTLYLLFLLLFFNNNFFMIIFISYFHMKYLILIFLIILLVCRPMEFLNCSQPQDLEENETARLLLGYGCTKAGHLKFSYVSDFLLYTFFKILI